MLLAADACLNCLCKKVTLETMASKKAKPMKNNAQAQNAVSERRLRPIYGKFERYIALSFFTVSLLFDDVK